MVSFFVRLGWKVQAYLPFLPVVVKPSTLFPLTILTITPARGRASESVTVPCKTVFCEKPLMVKVQSSNSAMILIPVSSVEFQGLVQMSEASRRR